MVPAAIVLESPEPVIVLASPPAVPEAAQEWVIAPYPY